MSKDRDAIIETNKQIGNDYYCLALKTGWSDYDPGQFVMVQVPDHVVLVRRPFSIARKKGNDGIELVYKVVGPGTRHLSEVKEGTSIRVMGPLGRGFQIPKGIKKIVIVAGGFGIAPFLEMLPLLQERGIETHLYYGGRIREDILFLDEFENHGVTCHISTEDGSLGAQGMVTEPLLKDISNYSKNSMIFCCGPKGLLDAVLSISKEYQVPAEVSYETYMGCGIGVCLGCVVKTKDGYKRACKDGPVFHSSELVI